MNKTSMLDRINFLAQKMGSQIHLRSLRDSFVMSIPFLVLAGLMILFNNVIIKPDGFLSNIIASSVLEEWQIVGNTIINGTMNILSLLISVLISYSLATNRKFSNPIIPVLVSLASIYVLMPLSVSLIPVGSENTVDIAGVVPYTLTGTNGIFVAIIVSLVATELFMKIAKNEKLQIKLGGNVPPAVAQSFNALFSIMLTILAFSLVSFGINELAGMGIHDLINKVIQAPLLGLTTSLPGFLILGFITNLLFSLGIHPGGIVNPILEPPLIVAMQQNMEAFAAGKEIPNIIVLPFRDLYGHLGGTGATIALLIAIFIKSRRKEQRAFAKLTAPTSIFNINEPVIFGYPVMFNPLIMIPFIFTPLLLFALAYFATWAGWVSKIVVYVPWSVPPLISGYLGSGGDWRNVVLQLVLMAIAVIIYLPFLMAYERTLPAEENNSDKS